MNDHAHTLSQSLTLPSGLSVENRLVKSATSENLGNRGHSPTRGLVRLYQRLGDGGPGLIITGNVMVDRRALGEPRNVVLEDGRDMETLRQWAAAGKSGGSRLFMQLNHPGRQSPKGLSRPPVAPSAVPFGPAMARFFDPPRALTQGEIQDLVERFGKAAGLAQEAGFDGVQIHGAHGYLVSQFLSPLVNRREDEYGGSTQNRMRFLMEIYQSIRQHTGKDFSVAAKLNSADFQNGGFTEDESIQVARALAESGLDLLEISGGSYESPAMTGRKHEGADNPREAYFLDFAARMRKQVDAPLLVTGGFRTAQGMAAAIDSKDVDLVGLARPLCVDPELPRKVLSGQDYVSPIKPIKTGFAPLDRAAMLEVSWYELQLGRMARGQDPKPGLGAWTGLFQILAKTGLQTFSRKRAK